MPRKATILNKGCENEAGFLRHLVPLDSLTITIGLRRWV